LSSSELYLRLIVDHLLKQNGVVLDGGSQVRMLVAGDSG